jgi:hypothetical protein
MASIHGFILETGPIEVKSREASPSFLAWTRSRQDPSQAKRSSRHPCRPGAAVEISERPRGMLSPAGAQATVPFPELASLDPKAAGDSNVRFMKK